jgi:hypothetical protein
MSVVRSTCVVACVALLLSAMPGAAAEESFSFYGLQFGTPKAEVAKQIPLSGTIAKNPGHGMSDLELVFDREDLLVEIRASWPRPEDPLVYQGVLRALREKFVAPTGLRFPAIAVTLDEYSNRAAIRLVFLATNIREKNIEYHKAAFLKTLQ